MNPNRPYSMFANLPQFATLATLPAGTPAYMQDAYVGCLIWAIGKPELVQQFEEATGAMFTNVSPASNREYFLKFKVWHDENVWGKVEA